MRLSWRLVEATLGDAAPEPTPGPAASLSCEVRAGSLPGRASVSSSALGEGYEACGALTVGQSTCPSGRRPCPRGKCDVKTGRTAQSSCDEERLVHFLNKTHKETLVLREECGGTCMGSRTLLTPTALAAARSCPLPGWAPSTPPAASPLCAALPSRPCSLPSPLGVPPTPSLPDPLHLPLNRGHCSRCLHCGWKRPQGGPCTSGFL